MKTLYAIFGMVILLAFSSCNTVRVSSDYDRAVDFAQYKSFAFHQKGLERLKMNDLDKRRVVSAIVKEMQAKGMAESKSELTADLIINLSAKSKTRVDVRPNFNPWWGYGPFWGNTGERVTQHKEGTVIMDFVDRKNNTLVWQGVGAGLNISNLEGKAEKIPLAVQEILKKYPPSK